MLNIQKTKIMASGPITLWQIDEETVETVTDLILGGSKITADGGCSRQLKDACSLEEKFDQPRQHIKKHRHYFVNRGLSSQSYSFSCNHVWMWSWTVKKAEHWRIYAFKLGLEKTLESPLDCKEIKLVNSKGNQPWIFTGRTDAEAEAPILWLSDMWRADSLEKTLMLERLTARGEGDDRGWDGWMAPWTQWIWVWAR